MTLGFLIVLFYLFVWWLVLFMALPFGAHLPENPETGHSAGAPAKTHLKTKLIATTLIAAVITFLFFWITGGELIDFDAYSPAVTE